MPIYDYVCEAGHRVEVMHGVHADGPTTCGICGARLRKAVSAPAIVFKGSGWAKVDARRATAKSSGDSSDGGSSEKDKSSSSDGKADKAAASAAKSDSSESSGSSSADPKNTTAD